EALPVSDQHEKRDGQLLLATAGAAVRRLRRAEPVGEGGARRGAARGAEEAQARQASGSAGSIEGAKNQDKARQEAGQAESCESPPQGRWITRAPPGPAALDERFHEIHIVSKLSDLILRSKSSPSGRRLASRRMATCTAVALGILRDAS